MREILFTANRKDNGKQVKGYYCKWKHKEYFFSGGALNREIDCIIEVTPDEKMIRHVIDPETLHRCDRHMAVKVIRKILFPAKCVAAILLSPLLLMGVGALLVIQYEDQLLD